MPLKPEYFPNERVDLEDFTQSSRGYTDSKSAFDAIKQFLGNKARLLEGFRIEIPDQTSFTGQFTIHNGVALDKAGRPLNNEDQVSDSRTEKLLGGPTTFFVEIEFFQDPTAQDNRAFWDPTFPNTAPDIDGKEFSIPTKTRLSPDWRIVTPFNTVGFEADRESAAFVLNTNRIPIAQLTTNGSGEIVVQGGIVPVVVSGTLEEDGAPGDTFIRLLNSRLFPITVGPPTSITIGLGATSSEVLTISDNDRVNGVITLGAGLANTHKAGEIIRVVGATATFIPQRTEPIPDLTGATNPDPTRKQFQGNERRGRALTNSKETFGSRDDLNIETLKDEVDALSALIHEMKFGSRRPDELGTLADDHLDRLPPHVVTTPRYWDMAGSLMGIRTATLTIGDGVTTFGDFNGADHKPFQDAVDNLPAAGGTIFVKGGNYTFTAEVNYSNRSVIWVGESANLVTISFSSGGQAIFDASTADFTVFRNLTLAKSGANQRAIRLDGVVDVRIEQCVILGEVFSENAGGITVSVSVVDSRLLALAVDAPSRRALRVESTLTLRVDNSIIIGEVHFLDTVADSTFRALNSGFTPAAVDDTSAFRGSDNPFSFFATNCTFFADDTSFDQRVIRFEAAITRGRVDGCDFIVGDGAIFAIEDDITSFSLNNAKMTTLTGGALVDAADASVWSSVHFNGIEVLNPSAATLDASKTDYIQLGILQNCSFKNIRTANPLFANNLSNSFIRWGATDHLGIFFNQVVFENITINFSDTAGGRGIAAPGADGHTGTYDVSVKRCEFQGCSIGIVCRKPGTLSVDDCRILGGLTGTHQGNRGVTCGPRTASTVQDITIEDSIFRLIQGTPEINAFGVQVLGPVGTVPPAFPPDNMVASLVVKNCIFTEIGNPSIHSGVVAGISTEDNTRMSHIVISGNEFDRLDATDDPSTILRSVFIRGFQPTGSAASDSIHIHNNNFHDQGSVSSLDTGFVEIDRTVEDLSISSCSVHDNTFALLFGLGLGLFAVKLEAEIINRVAICRNHFAAIGASTADDSEASGVIYLAASVLQGIQVSENNILQVGSVSAIPAIRVAAGAAGGDGIAVSNNTIVCGSRTWRPIYISGAVSLDGTTVTGNTINGLSQVWSAKLDSGIHVTAGTPQSTTISNNNIKEDTFLDIRSAITLEATSFGDDAVVSGNVVRMPDPGVGNARISVIRLNAILNHVVSNNMVRAVDSDPPLGSSVGILIAGLSDGLVVGNYVLPGLDGIVIDMLAAGNDSVALSNVVGTSTDSGSIAIAVPTTRAKQGNLTLLDVTNLGSVT